MAAVHSLVNITPNVYNRDYITWGVYNDTDVHPNSEKHTILQLSLKDTDEDGNSHSQTLTWENSNKTGSIKDLANGIQLIQVGTKYYIIHQKRVIRACLENGVTTVICGDGKIIDIADDVLATLVAS